MKILQRPPMTRRTRARGWCSTGRSVTVRARPGRLSTLGIFHSKLISCGAFVWLRAYVFRMALNSPQRRVPARAVDGIEEMDDFPCFVRG
jgi:hypothetical protein